MPEDTRNYRSGLAPRPANTSMSPWAYRHGTVTVALSLSCHWQWLANLESAGEAHMQIWVSYAGASVDAISHWQWRGHWHCQARVRGKAAWAPSLYGGPSAPGRRNLQRYWQLASGHALHAAHVPGAQCHSHWHLCGQWHRRTIARCQWLRTEVGKSLFWKQE
jgi:hypothetical protein